MEPKWIGHLSDEELLFLKHFILSSGSLKEIAQIYNISYPTVRLRLDRIIEKIKVWDSEDKRSDFEKALLIEYAEGRVNLETMKTLLAAHRKEIKP
jgi:hypothetical protein